MQKGSIESIKDFVEANILSVFNIFETRVDFSSSVRDAKSKSVKTIHGKGGSMISGYFNPSPIFELIVEIPNVVN